jgi:hypothetical protein
MRSSLLNALAWVARYGRNGRTFRRREFWDAFPAFAERTRKETWSELGRERGIVKKKDKIIEKRRGRPAIIYEVADGPLLALLTDEGVIKPALRKIKALASREVNAYAHPAIGPPIYIELCLGGDLLSAVAPVHSARAQSVLARLRRSLRNHAKPHDWDAAHDAFIERATWIDDRLREISKLLTELLGADSDYACSSRFSVRHPGSGQGR